jgi:hypothetical protein
MPISRVSSIPEKMWFSILNRGPKVGAVEENSGQAAFDYEHEHRFTEHEYGAARPIQIKSNH